MTSSGLHSITLLLDFSHYASVNDWYVDMTVVMPLSIILKWAEINYRSEWWANCEDKQLMSSYYEITSYIMTARLFLLYTGIACSSMVIIIIMMIIPNFYNTVSCLPCSISLLFLISVSRNGSVMFNHKLTFQLFSLLIILCDNCLNKCEELIQCHHIVLFCGSWIITLATYYAKGNLN